METIEIQVYSFEELDDKAKERARDWWKQGLDYPWFDDALASIRAFVGYFGGQVNDWSIGDRGRDYIKTDVTKDNFRGLKLKEFKPDFEPTGYCLDYTLWGTFHSTWKQTSDPLYAFEQALEAAMCDVASDVEYQYTDESVDENLIINEYQFTKDGRIF